MFIFGKFIFNKKMTKIKIKDRFLICLLTPLISSAIPLLITNTTIEIELGNIAKVVIHKKTILNK
jgi:hypothetical protein